MKLPDYNNRLRVLVATYVTFSPNGTELLVNMGGEQVRSVSWGGSAPSHCALLSCQHCVCHMCIAWLYTSSGLVVNDIISIQWSSALINNLGFGFDRPILKCWPVGCVCQFPFF